MTPAPIPAQTRPAVGPPRRAAIRATTGIGHGAESPLPQPARSPVGTEIGSLTPNGAPSTFSLAATTEPNAVEAAKAAAATTNGRLTEDLGRSAASVMTMPIA